MFWIRGEHPRDAILNSSLGCSLIPKGRSDGDMDIYDRCRWRWVRGEHLRCSLIPKVRSDGNMDIYNLSERRWFCGEHLGCNLIPRFRSDADMEVRNLCKRCWLRGEHLGSCLISKGSGDGEIERYKAVKMALASRRTFVMLSHFERKVRWRDRSMQAIKMVLVSRSRSRMG